MRTDRSAAPTGAGTHHPHRAPSRTARAASVAVVVALVVGGLAALAGAARPAARATDARTLVFSPEGNNLDVYRITRPFTAQQVDTTHETDPAGWDINGEVCFLGPRRFIAGEDTGQPDPPAGWGVFTLRGSRVGDLSIRRVARLVPAYPASDAYPDTIGCGVLSDGRVVTTVIGNNTSGPVDGQLVLWFPPFTSQTGSSFCVLDDSIGTAGTVYVDDADRVFVASARGDTAGILRYDGPFPTAADEAGGCGGRSSAGAPEADPVHRTQFVRADAATNHLSVVNGVAGSGKGPIYASSIVSGTIVELDASGTYRRTILSPPAGESLGAKPFSTGTPLGLAVTPAGSVVYADLGLVIDSDGIGPGDDTGTVRVIHFRGGEPQAPVTIASDLSFPDGLGLWTPPRGRR